MTAFKSAPGSRASLIWMAPFFLIVLGLAALFIPFFECDTCLPRLRPFEGAGWARIEHCPCHAEGYSRISLFHALLPAHSTHEADVVGGKMD